MLKKFIHNKFIKNVFHLASGTAVTSILGLINTVLLVSAIGMEDNGAIFLAQSYVGFFNSLLNFQSYEAVIKFLPNHMNKEDEDGKNYIKLALFLDLITAILAFVMAILLLDKVTYYLEWSPQVKQYIKILVPTILFTITGSFTGILRIYGKFKYIAISTSSGSIITFILYLIGLTAELSTVYYVLTFLITRLLVTLLDCWFTYKTLRQNSMHKLDMKKVRWDKDFIKFTIATNISTTLDLPITHLIPIIINRYLGFTEISVYKILEKVGGIVSVAMGIFRQVITPEISKRLADKNIKGALKITRLMRNIVILSGIFILVGIAITKQWWLGIFIYNYKQYIIAIYLYFIYVVYTSAFSLQHPLFIFAGFARYNIYILSIVNSIYLLLAVYMTKNIGLSGLILSGILQATLVFLSKAIILKKFISEHTT